MFNSGDILASFFEQVLNYAAKEVFKETPLGTERTYIWDNDWSGIPRIYEEYPNRNYQGNTTNITFKFESINKEIHTSNKNHNNHKNFNRNITGLDDLNHEIQKFVKKYDNEGYEIKYGKWVNNKRTFKLRMKKGYKTRTLWLHPTWLW